MISRVWSKLSTVTSWLLDRLSEMPWEAYPFVAIAVFACVVIGLIVSKAFSDQENREACETACEPNITITIASNACQCATPGDGGKVYYVKPKGQEP